MNWTTGSGSLYRNCLRNLQDILIECMPGTQGLAQKSSQAFLYSLVKIQMIVFSIFGDLQVVPIPPYC